MAAGSFARDALKSYLPESVLAQQGEVHALAIKYETKLELPGHTRRMDLLTKSYYRQELQTGDLDVLQTDKILGGLVLGYSQGSPVEAVDPEHPEMSTYRSDPDPLTLHVSRYNGPEKLADDLASAAEYITRHHELEETPMVLGVTYPPFARVAVKRYGFRPMETTSVEPNYAIAVRAVHMAQCKINGLPMPPATEPVSSVYLPTPEFIDRFSMTPLTNDRPGLNQQLIHQGQA